MNYKQIDTIFWDWNGTLLNDTSICIGTMNILLKSRNIKKLSLETYREIFTFPVKEYYEKAGFDFENEAFEIPATEFIELYNIRMADAPLHTEVNNTLAFFKKKGMKQNIISAMKQDQLLESVRSNGVFSYFDHIAGLNDHYASGKVDAALNLISNAVLNPENICLIGDTIHDAEVAKEIGCTCILISIGHQSIQRLKSTGNHVVSQLSDVVKIFQNHKS